MADWPSISIVIPNYNGERVLSAYLPSVIEAAHRYPGESEIIVSDDASIDDSNSIVARFPECLYVMRDRNAGFSANCNYGARFAKFEILLFLNNDVKIAPDFLVHAALHFQNDECFAVTPLGRSMSDGHVIDQAIFMKWRIGKIKHSIQRSEDFLRERGQSEPFRCQRVQGAYFFVKKEKFDALKGFDEIYNPYYWEETDLSYRALKMGWHIVFEPKCEAWHEVGSTIASHAGSIKRTGRAKRNQILFHVINMHNRRMLTMFLFATFLNLITLKPSRWYAFISAVPRLRRALKRRHENRRFAKLSDSRVLGEFTAALGL